jgi:hypothetical protein
VVCSLRRLEVAKERKAHVESNRTASAKLFDSTKLTVVPETEKTQVNPPGPLPPTAWGLFLCPKNSTGSRRRWPDLTPRFGLSASFCV